MTDLSLRVAAHVQDALDRGIPVVAPESTIFTHGLPRPRNIEVALRGEEIIRELGAIAATIGVVHGRPVVGLTADEINELAHDDAAAKASIRDLSYAAVTRKNAGTTIAATAFFAKAAESTSSPPAVSAGCTTARPTTVRRVGRHLPRWPRSRSSWSASGAKAILDIPRNAGAIRDAQRPGGRLPHRTATPASTSSTPATTWLRVWTSRPDRHDGRGPAAISASTAPSWSPTRSSADEQLDPARAGRSARRAWAAAEDRASTARPRHPFLLDFIRVATDGRSLDANVALYYNNIRLAAQIAAELTK